jgi:uncharacterized protein (TIGR03435 family)
MRFVLLVATLAAASAQTPPSFEVATVKPSEPGTPMAIRRSGHRIVTTATSLQFLISWAYDLHTDLIYGKPGWLDSARYDVVAAAPEGGPLRGTPPGQPTILQQMMQTLLAERFKLVVHREKRDLPLYALVVGKGGPKFDLTKAPEVMGQTPFNMPSPGRLTGTQVTAWMLAKVLSGQLNKTVQDHSGLAGVFDFKLEWQPDGMTDIPGASLFTAVQEQLGLRLEARRGPVEVLVIDRVENAPTAN